MTMTYQPEWHPEHVNTKEAMERILAIVNGRAPTSSATYEAWSIILDREREIAHLRAQIETERVRRRHEYECAALTGLLASGKYTMTGAKGEATQLADAAHGPIVKGPA